MEGILEETSPREDLIVETGLAVADERNRYDDEASVLEDPPMALTFDCNSDFPFLSVTFTMLPMILPSSSTSLSFKTEPGINFAPSCCCCDVLEEGFPADDEAAADSFWWRFEATVVDEDVFSNFFGISTLLGTSPVLFFRNASSSACVNVK